MIQAGVSKETDYNIQTHLKNSIVSHYPSSLIRIAWLLLQQVAGFLHS